MRKKPLSKGSRGFLHILQHALIVVAAVCVLIVLTGSSVMIRGVDGNYSYSMDMDEKEVPYEESLLFNHIYGRGIADVARMVAVCSQMETDGVFDGNKEIDVAAFYYRYEGIPHEYVTAKYRLEDLIKWAQYGFEYERQEMTAQEVEEFLSQTSRVTQLNMAGSVVTPYNAPYEEYTQEYSVSANGLEYGDLYRSDVTKDILLNRYQTTEGKKIEEYTGTWVDYENLCLYVTKTANALNLNYQEYLQYKEFYDSNASNLRYYIIKEVGDRQEIYTNLRSADWSKDEMTARFEQFGKYLYFNPDNMKYMTNTRIEEETVRKIFNAFEYAYPESIHVWIGVDTTYPVEDVYIQGLNGYTDYVPYYWQLLGIAALCLLVYGLLLIYLTVKEGRMLDENGELVIALKKIDHVPTECSVIVAIALLSGIIILFLNIFDSMSYEYYYELWFKVVAGIVVLVCELLFSGLYYSMVRRLKADNLWKESLTYKLLVTGKTTVWKLYDNGDIVIKTWVPYILFLIINLILILLGWQGMVVAACIDVALGVLLYRNTKDRQKIVKGIEKIKEGDFKYKVDEKNLHGDNLVLAQSVNSIGEGIRTAVETSMKDERLKTDLITNVSHDIKTPLTSIINYVDLIKRENIENEKVNGYVEVLDAKSQRLKQLTDDLVEASKISSGNISLNWERINLVELVNQTLGEFSEKFEQKCLTPVIHTAYSNMYVEADSRRIWRVMENLFNNIFKYALEGTRVYIDMTEQNGINGVNCVEVSIKNISAQPLNIKADELTERFIRGDVARSTEGSGLGLSIAKNLTEAQKGSFEIRLDGDLFKVVLTFPLLERSI